MNLYNVLSNRYVGMSNFERLFAQKFGGTGGKIKELEGVPPLTFTANGQPLLDYRIYGNTVQTGTPTPENPIMPSGCGERTENLFRSEDATPTSQNYREFRVAIETELNTAYNIKNYTGNMVGIYIYGNPDYTSERITVGYYRDNLSFNSGTYSMAYIGIVIPAGRDYRTDKIYIGKGSTAPASYIPYGYKLPLTSAGQGVDIYLGESQTTRRIKKLVLTGEETWGYTALNHIAYLATPNSFLGEGVSVISTHYTAVSNKATYTQLSDKQCCLREDRNHLWIRDDDYSAVTEFKAYLAAQYAAGTPVTVWYVFAEPETGIVNEPLMKIGDYADTISMEQAGVSIPTAAGSTVIDYDGTLKPSQMYIKYKS